MIQVPDGTKAAMRAYGEYGTRDVLAATVAKYATWGAAQIYGVSPMTLRAWLLRAGLPTRRRDYARVGAKIKQDKIARRDRERRDAY